MRNISLAGYGQWAWLIGAEEISAARYAPQKLQAASAYSFPLKDQRLDGDIAWDASGGNVFAPPGGAPAQPRRIAAS